MGSRLAIRFGGVEVNECTAVNHDEITWVNFRFVFYKSIIKVQQVSIIYSGLAKFSSLYDNIAKYG